jgi:5-methylcytosine-specific restriction endonuclease McrA
MADFVIHRWTPPPRKKRDRDFLKADLTRKAIRFQRPDDSDERAMKEWRVRDIPGGTFAWEIALWLWEAGGRACPLCEQDIDIEVTEKQHPAKPEVDHIVPKVAGGDHTWGNVRVTHSVCNRFRNGGFIDLSLEWLPQQYRRAFDRGMERYSAPNQGRAKARQHYRATIDSHLRRIEFYEAALANPADPAATRWLSESMLKEGPDSIREAIAYNRREMETWERELASMDRFFEERDAGRAPQAEGEEGREDGGND